MERLYTQLRGRDFEILAVSEDEDEQAAVGALARELRLTFPVLIDPERQVGFRYRVWGYPESFIIDRNGFVVEHVIGPRQWDTAAQVSVFEGLLAGPSPGAPRAPS